MIDTIIEAKAMARGMHKNGTTDNIRDQSTSIMPHKTLEEETIDDLRCHTQVVTHTKRTSTGARQYEETIESNTLKKRTKKTKKGPYDARPVH